MGNESSRHRLGRHRHGGGDVPITEDVHSSSIRDDYVKPQRRMDKLRRSLSIRRTKKSKKNAGADGTTPSPLSKTDTPSTSTAVASSTKPTSWQDDEAKVRDGSCSFHVKYLGSIEVADSRGMEICEKAIDGLLLQKKKSIKAILYVSGDALRVVDETNKTLLVDQTIEKVSFCAPDRFHENGFAYICRDGTTRRWLCHGFMAIKDTIRNRTTNSSGGERLSHAVGCAFSVCLEKKQKRERENVSMEVGPNHSFTRFGSFRQASLSERLEDPQSVIPAPQVVAKTASASKLDNPFAIERPKGNTEMLNRQNVLRASTGAGTSPFKRNTNAYTSLRPNELPSVQQQKLNAFTSKLSTVANNTPTTPNTTPPSTQTSSITTSLAAQANQIETISEVPEDSINTSPTAAIASPAQPSTATTTNELFDLQINSTVFDTPPQVPIKWDPFGNSTSKQPPPLPPMPVYQQHQQQQPFYQYSASIFATPQSPPQQQTPTMRTTYSQHTVNNTPFNTNETFESKWARLQANKKTTNPFAEDIAKKFEIKL